MNYQKIYDQLIKKRKYILVEGYKENHHIIPKCMGGSNNSVNLVGLSAREHFIAHLLLVKIYPKNRKLLYPTMRMSYNKKYNSKQYAWLKEQYSKLEFPLETRLKISKKVKEKFSTEEYKIKLSESQKKKWEDQEYRNKMVNSAKKRAKISDETREKLSIARKKRITSIETKRKMSEKAKIREEMKRKERLIK